MCGSLQLLVLYVGAIQKFRRVKIWIFNLRHGIYSSKILNFPSPFMRYVIFEWLLYERTSRQSFYSIWLLWQHNFLQNVSFQSIPWNSIPCKKVSTQKTLKYCNVIVSLTKHGTFLNACQILMCNFFPSCLHELSDHMKYQEIVPRSGCSRAFMFEKEAKKTSEQFN